MAKKEKKLEVKEKTTKKKETKKTSITPSYRIYSFNRSSHSIKCNTITFKYFSHIQHNQYTN